MTSTQALLELELALLRAEQQWHEATAARDQLRALADAWVAVAPEEYRRRDRELAAAVEQSRNEQNRLRLLRYRAGFR